MTQVNSIIADIKKGDVRPLYLLMGEEPYFIDRIAKCFTDHLLQDSEKFFDQQVYYGKDTVVDNLLVRLRSYPMTAKFQLVILKEAQQLPGLTEKLQSYADAPLPTTVLVICHKYKSVDKRKKLYRSIARKGVIFESKKLYDNQLAPWIKELVKLYGKTISPEAAQLLCDAVGTNLNALEKEIEKLCNVLSEGESISPRHIHTYTGISKDFNNFELQRAIANGDFVKAMRIAYYFSKDPKRHPFTLTVSVLFNFFRKLLIYHGIRDTSKENVARVLGISPHFTDEYKKAANLYKMRHLSAIINAVKVLDLKSKGIGAGSVSQIDLYKEILSEIFIKKIKI